VQLCLEEQGTLGNSIRCPYHGWTFDLDGQLIAAPFINDLPPETKERRLYAAAVTEWLGYIWDRFGDVDVPSHYGCEDLQVARKITYDVKGKLEDSLRELLRVLSLPHDAPGGLPNPSGMALRLWDCQWARRAKARWLSDCRQVDWLFAVRKGRRADAVPGGSAHFSRNPAVAERPSNVHH
jgi:hypothetical protein